MGKGRPTRREEIKEGADTESREWGRQKKKKKHQVCIAPQKTCREKRERERHARGGLLTTAGVKRRMEVGELSWWKEV